VSSVNRCDGNSLIIVPKATLTTNSVKLRCVGCGASVKHGLRTAARNAVKDFRQLEFTL